MHPLNNETCRFRSISITQQVGCAKRASQASYQFLFLCLTFPQVFVSGCSISSGAALYQHLSVRGVLTFSQQVVCANKSLETEPRSSEHEIPKHPLLAPEHQNPIGSSSLNPVHLLRQDSCCMAIPAAVFPSRESEGEHKNYSLRLLWLVLSHSESFISQISKQHLPNLDLFLGVVSIFVSLVSKYISTYFL